MERSLGFDDITLVPRVLSTVESRDDVKTMVKWPNGLKVSIPIIASPMKDVCDGRLAGKMKYLGGMGIIHRFSTIEDQVKEYSISKDSPCAVGINGDYKERFQALCKAGCSLLCLDVANGGNVRVGEVIEELSQENSSVRFIVGNVCSKECYEWLTNFSTVIGIRVNVATGAACSTKNATGIVRGAISTIKECATVKYDTVLIADGGIREPSDFCKAIAAGADAIMVGAAIANTSDSPAELIRQNKILYKVYHGSASFDIQSSYREKPRYIEGKTTLLEYEGTTLEEMMTKFSDGLRSSMSYFNARNIKEFQANATWELVR